MKVPFQKTSRLSVLLQFLKAMMSKKIKFYMKNSLAFSLHIQQNMPFYNFLNEFLTLLMKGNLH